MRRFHQFCMIVAMLAASQLGAETIEADIVIAGGSFSASAAAFAAARENPAAQVLLIEPGDWLGGQATMQGVAAIDNVAFQPAVFEIRNHPRDYYAADYNDFIDGMKTAPDSAPGEGYAGPSGWVSVDCFDPRTGAWVLDNMAAQFPNLRVMKLAVVKHVTTAPVSDSAGTGLRITSVSVIERASKPGYSPFDDLLSSEMPDWYSPIDSARFTKQTHTIVPADSLAGMVVIDATETGDVMVLSGAKYTQGREVSTEKIGEDGSLPAINDTQSLAMVYPFIMTTSAVVDAETDVRNRWTDFDAYLQARTNDYFDLGSFTWTDVWTYRRLYSGGSNSRFTINAGDASMQNWNPGNDFRQGNWLLSTAATNAQKGDWQGGVNLQALATAEEHTATWYFWLKQRQPAGFPGADTRLARGNDDLNMMGTAHGLSKFPYIRGTRRLVGLDNFRITSRYWKNTLAAGYADETSYRFYDSVGIGDYSADARALIGSTGIAPPFTQPAPFYIPYRALASANVRNLLASGKLMAQTWITNTGYRLHPIEWASGSAAGAAAAMMREQAMDNFELLPIPVLRSLQNTVMENAPIRWKYTGESFLPPEDGDLIVNDLTTLIGLTPFDIEVYHPTAVRAVINVNGVFLAETTTRSNGRLLYQSPGIGGSGNSLFFEAHCFNMQGGEIALLTATVPFQELPCFVDPTITDNDEGAPAFTLTGAWTSASAQGDRFCTERDPATYRYRVGTANGIATATWQLKIPRDGFYQISVWYSASSNRSTATPFTVNSLDESATTRINQRIDGGGWVALGEYPFAADSGSVVLGDNIPDAGDLVVGDAVRAEFQRPLQPEPGAGNVWVLY